MSIEIGIVLGLAALASGAFWRVWALIAEARKAGEDAQRNLDAHRLHTAETYVTKAGLSEQTSQIMKAIEGIASRIDGVAERLDRAFERTPTRRQ